MPLVADAAGVQEEGVGVARAARRPAEGRGDQARLAVRVMETPVPEKPRLARRLARPARPLERRERIVILLRDVGERAEVEAAPAGVLRRGEAGVFGENLGGRAV